ncbi:MAG: aldo/keto reductase [Chloroflexota bacterium]
MRYKTFGHSGLRVSELCLGTMTFGNTAGWGADKDESRKIFQAYVDAGGNFVDTARNYSDGESEKYVGEFIASERARFVLATKYTMARGVADPNATGNQRKNLVQTVEVSLKQLGTDYIDLYWIHAWDFVTPAEEIMRALDDLVRAGKVLYVGVSNAPAWAVARANTLAELRGWTPFVGLQVEYSLVQRAVERELLPMARALDVGVTAWSPLGAGLLTGKYAQGASGSGGGKGGRARRLDINPVLPVDARNLAIAEVVQEVANQVGGSPAQVALAWVRQRGVVPILGARTVAQLKDNLGTVDVTLSAEQVGRLDETSKIDLGYPHDFLARDNIRTFVYGGFWDRLDSPRKPR